MDQDRDMTKSAIRPVRPDQPVKPLCYVTNHQLKLFYLSTHTWQSIVIDESISVDTSTRYIWLDDDLFSSGGSGHLGHHPCGQRAHLLGPQWTLTKLADMMTSRYNHGLWWHRPELKVLIFGGYSKIHSRWK